MSKNILMIDFGGYNDSTALRRMVSNKAGFAWLYGDGDIKDRSTMNEICIGHKVNGIIILGGPTLTNSKHAQDILHWALGVNVPILGICYGMYLMGCKIGCKLARGTRQGYWNANLRLTVASAGSKLFKNVAAGSSLYLSNGDSLINMPAGFDITAETNPTSKTIVAFENGNMFGIQFCPEAQQTRCGSMVINNFVNIC